MKKIIYSVMLAIAILFFSSASQATIHITPTCQADFDHNGIVDTNDFPFLQAVFGQNHTGQEDLNNDGVITISDFAIFRASLGLVCSTPTPTPSPTQPPVVVTTQSSSGFSAPSMPNAPTCPDLKPTMVHDVWYSNYKITGKTASLILHWGTNSNYGKVNIAYGENRNEWRYAVLNIDNNGQFTIGGLKPRQTYWFQVAYVAGCMPGDYSNAIDP